jgi:hypothetical protein
MGGGGGLLLIERISYANVRAVKLLVIKAKELDILNG